MTKQVAKSPHTPSSNFIDVFATGTGELRLAPDPETGKREYSTTRTRPEGSIGRLVLGFSDATSQPYIWQELTTPGGRRLRTVIRSLGTLSTQGGRLERRPNEAPGIVLDVDDSLTGRREWTLFDNDTVSVRQWEGVASGPGATRDTGWFSEPREALPSDREASRSRWLATIVMLEASVITTPLEEVIGTAPSE